MVYHINKWKRKQFIISVDTGKKPLLKIKFIHNKNVE